MALIRSLTPPPHTQDGAFLVRHSSARDPRQPFTLAVLFQQKVYNIPIRFLEETHGYVLGKEGKKNEEVRRENLVGQKGRDGIGKKKKKQQVDGPSVSGFHQLGRDDKSPQEQPAVSD